MSEVSAFTTGNRPRQPCVAAASVACKYFILNFLIRI